MTVLTIAFCRSRFAEIIGFFTILGILALQAAGQTADLPSNVSDEHFATEPSVIESVADVSETSTVHITSDATQRLQIPQTETKRKPNLPASIVTHSASSPAESPAAKSTGSATESAVAEVRTK